MRDQPFRSSREMLMAALDDCSSKHDSDEEQQNKSDDSGEHQMIKSGGSRNSNKLRQSKRKLL